MLTDTPNARQDAEPDVVLVETFDLIGDVPMLPLGPGNQIKGQYQAPPPGWPKTRPGDYDCTTLVEAAAVAAVTGHGLDVIDIDAHHHGLESLAQLAEDNAIPEPRYVVRTPSGGYHLYVAPLGLPNSAGRIARGVDIRGQGGFVLMPPTPRYTNLDDRADWPRLGRFPEDAAERLRQRAGTTHDDPTVTTVTGEPSPGQVEQAEHLLSWAAQQVAQAEEGTRNDTLNRRAMLMYRFALGGCLSEDDVSQRLAHAARESGLGEGEVRTTLDNALRGAEKHGGTLPSASDPEADFEDLGPSRADDSDAAAEDPVATRFPQVDLFQLLDPNRPPRQWVVEGFIPAGASVSIVAPAGTGKSMLAFALALAVARGEPTFAGRPIQQPRRVLYVDMENSEDDIIERLQEFGVTQETAANLDRLILLSLPPLRPLDTKAGARELQDVLDYYGVGRDDLVILDSFQRVTEGPENDADTTRAFYEQTGMMLKRRRATVVRTDNTGKDVSRGARGSQGKADDVDLAWTLTREIGRSNVSQLSLAKQRISSVKSFAVALQSNHGRKQYVSVDPWRQRVDDAHAALDDAGVPRDLGADKAWKQIKAGGYNVTQSAVREAVKERKQPSEDFTPTAGSEER